MMIMKPNKSQVVIERDAEFCDEVVETGEKTLPDIDKVRTCIQCGTCVGGCPSGRRTAWRIKTLFQKMLLGLKDEVLSSDDLWCCTTCYTCQERCPRAISTTDTLRVIRNVSFREGYAKFNHLYVCSLLFNHGHAVPVNAPTKELRKKLGLDETPPTVHSFPEGLKEVNIICEKTGFKEVWEKHWTKAQEEKKKAEEAKKKEEEGKKK
jgi:heterodisulfide reductase subunit C